MSKTNDMVPIEHDLAVTLMNMKLNLVGDSDGDYLEKAIYYVENASEEQAVGDLRELSHFRGFNAFFSGGLLSVVHANQWYRNLGFTSFTEFVEGELGMARSTAYDYMEIYSRLEESGIKWEQVDHVGWTKVRLIARMLTNKNVEAWVKIATSCNAAQLRERVREQVAKVNSMPPEPNPYEVSTHADTSGNNEEIDINVTDGDQLGNDSSLAVTLKPVLVTKEAASKTKTVRKFTLYHDQEQTLNEALTLAKQNGRDRI